MYFDLFPPKILILSNLKIEKVPAILHTSAVINRTRKILNTKSRREGIGFTSWAEAHRIVVMEQSLWGHLPLLVRANSKESVESILEALWRTRKTGLDSADRHVIRDMLQLENDSDLDPVNSLVCLLIVINC